MIGSVAACRRRIARARLDADAVSPALLPGRHNYRVRVTLLIRAQQARGEPEIEPAAACFRNA
jgi:hypothetical protein